jgi:hypothetical protein
MNARIFEHYAAEDFGTMMFVAAAYVRTETTHEYGSCAP